MTDEFLCIEQFLLQRRMNVVVIVAEIMAVPVVFMVGAVSVYVAVGMFVGMSVNNIAVAVLMAVNVSVHMSVLKLDCVFYYKDSSGNHNQQCSVKLYLRPLSYQYHAEKHAKKGND